MNLVDENLIIYVVFLRITYQSEFCWFRLANLCTFSSGYTVL